MKRTTIYFVPLAPTPTVGTPSQTAAETAFVETAARPDCLASRTRNSAWLLNADGRDLQVEIPANAVVPATTSGV